MAVISHPSAHDVLVNIGDDLKRKTKLNANSYYWCTEVPAFVGQSMRFQARVAQAQSLLDAIGASLGDDKASDDVRFVLDLCTSVETGISPKELLSVLEGAIKYHKEKVRALGMNMEAAGSMMRTVEYLEKALGEISALEDARKADGAK